MRILVISQYFWPENFRINDLCAELVSRGHEVVVLTGLPNYPSGDFFPEFLQRPDDFQYYRGVKIYRVPILARGQGSVRLLLNYLSYAVCGSIVGSFKLRKKEFDVIFTCQLSPVTIALPAIFIAGIKKIPMAMWVLDLWPDSLSAVGIIKSEKVLNVISRLVKFIYSRCDLIFAQSRSFIPHIARLASSPRNIVYSPSWAEDVFQEMNVIPAQEICVQEDVFNVMFAGNIGEAQDFPCILRAAKRLSSNKKIRWLVVGDGRMSSWVRDEVERLGLSQQFILFGRYPVERMPSFFKHADVLLVTLADQPIFAMTIPGKLQSYLAAGMPIVAALNGEGADVIRRSEAGIAVSSGDDEALATAILELSKMTRNELKILGDNGLHYCQTEFQRKAVIDNFERHLSDIVNNTI